MSSPAQISANQANAQFSTGPRTPQGKAAVSQNAIRHGLTARHLVIRPDEHEEFATLQDSLLTELDPQGAIETVTFHELVHSAWSLHRFRRIEAQCSSGTPNDFDDPRIAAALDRLTRYQARSQRAYYKSLHELRALQSNRAIKPASEAAVEVPAPATIDELTKQTHSEVTTEGIGLKIVRNSTSLAAAAQLKTSLAWHPAA